MKLSNIFHCQEGSELSVADVASKSGSSQNACLPQPARNTWENITARRW